MIPPPHPSGDGEGVADMPVVALEPQCAPGNVAECQHSPAACAPALQGRKPLENHRLRRQVKGKVLPRCMVCVIHPANR